MPKQKTTDDPEEGDTSLVHSLHLRISERTRELLRQRAAKAGIKGATLARLMLDKALGIR